VSDLEKTKEQLIAELVELRAQVTALEGRVDEYSTLTHQQWHSLVDNTPAVILILDRDHKIRFINHTRPSVLKEEIIGRRPDELCVPEHREIYRRSVDRVFHSGKSDSMEIAARGRDDQVRWYLNHLGPIFEGGQVVAVSVIAEEITEQKGAEDALRQSEERYRSLVEACPDAVLMSDLRGQVLFASPQAQDLVGLPDDEELADKLLVDFVVEEERRQVTTNLARLLDAGVRRDIEYNVLRRDGTTVPVEVSSALIRDAAGQPKAVMVIVRDVTVRKRALAALARERRTLFRMLRASDHERQLIAYDIHDGLAQQLAAAIMQFETWQHLEEKHHDKAETVYEAGVEMLRQAHSEARRLISGVRPPILDESGFVAAIAHLVHDQRVRTGLKIELFSDVEVDRLPAVAENAVYRIVQEALANACRHSGSPRVRVSLVQQGDMLRLGVQDWGIGFDPEAVLENRFGLSSIRERTRLLGGELLIESAPGQGTHVRVEMPIVARGGGEDSV